MEPRVAAGCRLSEIRRFQPDQILRVLTAHEVLFVVVGGLAAQAHGSSSLTNDLDICYARDRAAGRPKDRIELEILGALREELDRRD